MLVHGRWPREGISWARIVMVGLHLGVGVVSSTHARRSDQRASLPSPPSSENHRHSPLRRETFTSPAVACVVPSAGATVPGGQSTLPPSLALASRACPPPGKTHVIPALACSPWRCSSEPLAAGPDQSARPSPPASSVGLSTRNKPRASNTLPGRGSAISTAPPATARLLGHPAKPYASTPFLPPARLSAAIALRDPRVVCEFFLHVVSTPSPARPAAKAIGQPAAPLPHSELAPAIARASLCTIFRAHATIHSAPILSPPSTVRFLPSNLRRPFHSCASCICLQLCFGTTFRAVLVTALAHILDARGSTEDNTFPAFFSTGTCIGRRAVTGAFVLVPSRLLRAPSLGRSMSRPYSTSPAQNNNDSSLSAILASHLHQGQPPQQPMDARQQPEYPQSGLSSPYANYNGHQSEGTSADQASAVQYPAGQEYKPSNFSSSATPDSSYGLPQSARSGSFPEYIQRSYADGQPQPARYQPGAQGNHPGMAQTSSPSLPMADGQQPNGHASQHNIKSDGDVPIDPSIAQSSPSYPPPHNYSPYPPQQEIPQYAAHPMYARPEWQQGQYPQPMQYGHSPASSAGGAPGMVAHHIPRPPPGGHPLSTVYSFVPIPGAQQHKRPRRRYEEIERMYKCGWNGCEKAYGTLNHLNAHVTMQSHGSKRTPEEFKEIRKEWKAKKKEEENQRKQEDERARQEAQRQGQDTSQPQGQPAHYGQPHMMPPQMGGPQLPPIGYQAAAGQPAGQYAQPQQVDGAPQYSGNGHSMYAGQGYPQSPYGQGGLPYQQQEHHGLTAKHDIYDLRLWPASVLEAVQLAFFRKETLRDFGTGFASFSGWPKVYFKRFELA
ncbi:hypothetical protein Q7P37_004584 [Cladosporium fusiforme]